MALGQSVPLQSLLTHLGALLVLPPHCQLRSVQQSLGNPVRNIQSRAPWLCNHRYRGTQQTDSFGQGKLPTPPDLSGSASVICGHILCLDCGRCVTDDSSMFEVQLYPLRFTQDPYHWILCIVLIAQELFSLWNPWLEAQWKGRAVL